MILEIATSINEIYYSSSSSSSSSFSISSWLSFEIIKEPFIFPECLLFLMESAKESESLELLRIILTLLLVKEESDFQKLRVLFLILCIQFFFFYKLNVFYLIKKLKWVIFKLLTTTCMQTDLTHNRSIYPDNTRFGYYNKYLKKLLTIFCVRPRQDCS